MNFAMIKNGSNFVENTIVADPDFTLDGYYFVEIKDNVFCQSGMYYNANDGLFYLDKLFTKIYPTSTNEY